MKEKIIKQKNIAAGIAMGLLLLAIPPDVWPYGYYVFLRWAVTGTALFVLWAALDLNKITWVWIMGAVAILFNPIAPIHLDKSTWGVIDFIVAGLFLLSIFQIKNKDD